MTAFIHQKVRMERKSLRTFLLPDAWRESVFSGVAGQNWQTEQGIRLKHGK